MTSYANEAAGKSDVTSPDEETIGFDDETLRAIAEVYYNEGNEEYRKENFTGALHFYTEGLNVNCKDEELRAKLYINRAEAHFSLENYSDSLSDAKLATELQPSFVKAILSGANACVKLNLFEDAITWCDKGLTIEKDNQMLVELRNMSVKTKSSPADKVDSSLESEAVDNKLNGAKHGKTAAENKFGQERADFVFHSGVRYLNQGDFQAALKCFEVLLKSAKDAGDKEAEACAHGNLAICYDSLGDPTKAIEYHQQALSITNQVGDKDSEGRSYINLGNTHSSLGDFKKAIGCYEQALSFAKQVGNKDSEGTACFNLGNTHSSLGDFKKAIESYQQALIVAKQVGNKTSEGNAYINLGNAHNSLGDVKKAIEYHQKALRIAKQVGNKESEEKAYFNLGKAHKFLSDFKKAIEYYEQALSIAKQRGDKDLEGTVYTNLGNTHFSLRHFEKAIEYSQQALSIAKQVGNKDLEGAAYENLGSAHSSHGDFKKAIDYHQQALIISKQVGNKDLEATAYRNLGNTHFSLCGFEKAIECYQQALSIAKQVGNKDLEGNEYINLGNAHYSLSDFKKAIECYRQALRIAKQAGNKDLEEKAYVNLGAAHSFLSDFKKAIECYQQGLSIAKQSGNKDLEKTAYINLGCAHYSLGDFKKAIEYHQQALSIAKLVGNKDSEGNEYINLSNAHFSLSDFKKAIEYSEQGLSIAKQVGNKDKEGKAYLSLGNAHKSLSNFTKAVEYYQQALHIAKQVGNKNLEGTACTNLGNVHFSLRDFEKAIEYSQEALSIAKRVGSKDSEGVAFTSLGNAHVATGDFEKAIEYFQQGLSIAKQVGNKDSEGTAYINLGRAHNSSSEFEKAIECFQQAVSIGKQVGNKILEGMACANLGHVYIALNDVSLGEEFYKSSVGLFNETRVLLKSNDEWKIALRNQYDSVYRTLWLVQLEQNKIKEALCTAERGRSQALMDLMESEYCVKLAQPDSDDNISSVLKYLTSRTVFLAEAPSLVNFWLLQDGQPCEFVQKAISDDLESMTHNAYKHIGVFKKVMCENRSLDEPVDEESEEVSERNSDERELITEEGAGDPLKVLSDVLIGPISHSIQGDEVVIVPDAALFLVPYAALVDQHSRYLSETLRIRLAPTLTSLKLMAVCPEEDHSASDALIVGDPWIQSVRINGKKYRQLPAAKQEVEMIGDILSIAPLTEKNATKAEVLRRMNSVALIHIAAHGRPETGEVVLSPNSSTSKRPKEKDFLLTMADVLSVKLRASLVVLSCCHSGRGKIKAEGVVGLARAFLGAGARSVLASLWAIDDEATVEFMRCFYEHLVKGQSAGKALNQAMKRMRESDDFSDVKYWAPFVLIGDDVTLKFGELSKAADV